MVAGLADVKVEKVAAGLACSFAIASSGTAYAWGFGESLQLASGDESVSFSSLCYLVALAGDKRLRVATGETHLRRCLATRMPWLRSRWVASSSRPALCWRWVWGVDITFASLPLAYSSTQKHPSPPRPSLSRRDPQVDGGGQHTIILAKDK